MSGTAVELPQELVELLAGPATCYLTTLMPDAGPQVTHTWADTDVTVVLVKTVLWHQKVANVRRDPRVPLALSSPSRPSRYLEVRGRVVSIDPTGAAEHIDVLSRRYTGGPYAWYGGRGQQRLVLAIAPEKINAMG